MSQNAIGRERGPLEPTRPGPSSQPHSQGLEARLLVEDGMDLRASVELLQEADCLGWAPIISPLLKRAPAFLFSLLIQAVASLQELVNLRSRVDPLQWAELKARAIYPFPICARGVERFIAFLRPPRSESRSAAKQQAQ